MKEKIIMWGAVIGLAIVLLLIPTKGNALSKDEIKDHVYNAPFDFEQISRDSEAYQELLFRERDRIFNKLDSDKTRPVLFSQSYGGSESQVRLLLSLIHI